MTRPPMKVLMIHDNFVEQQIRAQEAMRKSMDKLKADVLALDPTAVLKFFDDEVIVECRKECAADMAALIAGGFHGF